MPSSVFPGLTTPFEVSTPLQRDCPICESEEYDLTTPFEVSTPLQQGCPHAVRVQHEFPGVLRRLLARPVLTAWIHYDERP